MDGFTIFALIVAGTMVAKSDIPPEQFYFDLETGQEMMPIKTEGDSNPYEPSQVTREQLNIGYSLPEIKRIKIDRSSVLLTPTPKTFGGIAYKTPATKLSNKIDSKGVQEVNNSVDVEKDSISPLPTESKDLSNSQSSFKDPNIKDSPDYNTSPRFTYDKTCQNIAPHQVEFLFDSSYVMENQRFSLFKYLDSLRECGYEMLSVLGHTSPEGSNDYNMHLAVDRAKATRRIIIEYYHSARFDIKTEDPINGLSVRERKAEVKPLKGRE